MSENPYAAPQDAEAPKIVPRVEQVRGWRTWLLLFSGVIIVLCIIGWLCGILVALTDANFPQFAMMSAKWNTIANSMAGLFYLPYCFVVYRIARATGRTRLKAILYLIGGSVFFCFGDQSYVIMIPLGLLPVTLYLINATKEIISNSQAEYQNVFEKEIPS